MQPKPPPRPGTDADRDTTLSDRRRPGRIATGNPHLIALMRRSFQADPPGAEDELRVRAVERDDLAPARGIGLAVGIGILLWAMIAVIVIVL